MVVCICWIWFICRKLYDRTSKIVSAGIIAPASVNNWKSWFCIRTVSKVSALANKYLTRYVGTVLCPNITGAFFNAFNRSGGYAGAFYGSGSIQGYNGTHNQGTYPKDTKFEAGKSNTIYKNSTTVQPLAFQVLIIIKIWNAVGCKVSAAPNIALSLFAENRAPNTWLRFASP